MPKRNDGTFDEVGFRSAVGRFLAGGGFGPLELLGGPFAAAYSITGATEHAGVLFGGEALARFARRPSVRSRRARVRWVDGSGYATPRVGVAIGVGLAWDWPS